MPKSAIKLSRRDIVRTAEIHPGRRHILVVVGGIYAGWFPPSVGGAIGTLAVFIYGLITKVPFRTMFHSFKEAVILTGQVYLFLITAFLFARLVALSKVSDNLLNAIAQANLNPYIVMTIVIVIFLILGCLMDILPMLVIMLPIVFPLLTKMGFDETALAIIIILLSSIGGITPPVGLGVFLISTVAKVPPAGIFRKMLPFFLAVLAAVILLVFIPGIATVLPNLMQS
jgi:TRAP-type C4-dicarboxylate transport system permease large subunit